MNNKYKSACNGTIKILLLKSIILGKKQVDKQTETCYYILTERENRKPLKEIADLQVRKEREAVPLYYSEAQTLACISRSFE
jgi:hypothetical protein